jgi:hypothetical protein
MGKTFPKLADRPVEARITSYPEWGPSEHIDGDEPPG